jgi:signal transduction histidine kinase
MENFKPALKNMLRHEVADKGRAAAIYFGLFAAFVIYYGFSCTKYAWLIKGCAAFIILLSIFRLRLTNAFRKSLNLNDKLWNNLRLNIWLNMVCWSILLTTASVELEFTGVHFIVVTTVLCGFISSSLITLSPDMTLFLPFQFLMLGPQLCFMIYDALTANKYGLGALIPVYFMYLMYQVKQVRDFRRKIIQNFNSQLNLKKTNDELQSSQEAQVQQTVKLIHTSRLAALGEMAAGIAHEVNNPLAIISGSLQQLERKFDRQEFSDIEALKRHTGRSQQAIERITKIINGLRLFSQQSDTLPKVKVTLKEIVNDTLGFCAEMLKARYVRLDIEPIPEATIECHPVQISQVLINLIKNAEDALGAELDESERWVKILFEEKSDLIKIHVINGGKRIPDDIQDKLFIPFFTTKGVGEGTGLGLSISRGIMHEHGGDLILNDSEKQTTFTILLPKA